MATKNGKARRRYTEAELYAATDRPDVKARLNVNARLLDMDNMPEDERKEWCEEAGESLEKLRLTLRELVVRHFPGATAACVVVQPIQGGPAWCLPLNGTEVPDCIDLPNMSFRP